MKVSIEFMKRYSDPRQWKLPLDKLTQKIGAQLGAVEEAIGISGKYDHIIVADVVEAAPHPDADKLNIYQVFDGHKNTQVVSGDKKIKVGDKVAWLKPGATVPATWGSAEPLVLTIRDMRGEASNGMFGSGKELDINDDHEGVAILDTGAPAGTPFAEAYNLNDAIIDIENKMFTHRPDGFGQLGVAREIAGIQGLPFTSPDWYTADAEMPEVERTPLPLQIKNEIPQLVPRYTAIVIDGITIGPSPLWLQSYLHRLGLRSINNVVDITNYYMVLTGQPLHAFDYDKVQGATIVVRKPKKGETLPLLDGKTITPHPDAMLIADAQKPIGLGGMMGGANSEITDATTRIVLESATFDMFTIRRTSMHHGVFTDAVTRFSKGQSPLQTVAVATKAAADIIKIAGGTIAGAHDGNHVPPAAQKRGSVHAPISLTDGFINARLGTQLSAEDMATTLNNVEITAETQGEQLIITPPFWRTDLEIPEDIVEEVGRLRGYDTLPHALPMRDASAATLEPLDELKTSIRDILSRAGANELQTYSFVSSRLLSDVGQEKKHAFAVRNALSPDLEHYRLSLTPSLLDKVHANIKAGYKEFALFEINKVHIKGADFIDCDGLPREFQTVALVFASDNPLPGAPYYYAKRYLDYLFDELGVPHDFRAIEHPPVFEIGRQVFAPFEIKRTACAYAGQGQLADFAGFVGEYRGAVVKKLKLPRVVAGFEVDIERLLQHRQPHGYQPLLKFPATEQDVCLKVAANVAYADVVAAARQGLSADERLRSTIAPLDIYQRQGDAGHKQITLRIILQHQEHTLTTAETNELLDNVVTHVAKKLGAERV